MPDFGDLRDMFDLPEGVVYLDGNSLGPPLGAVLARVKCTVEDERGEMLTGAWIRAGWMAQPMVLGDRVGRLIGAPPGMSVVGIRCRQRSTWRRQRRSS